ncbi:MAG: multicopper oxidase family protein [Rhodoplanes sp.]
MAKFVRPLVISPVMPPTDENLVVRGGKNVSYYEIAVRQFQQEILPVGNYPQTKVWSYCSANNRAGTLNYPAFTIETTYKKPVRVKWINELVNANGNFLPHLLAVDQTLHWANPPGGMTERDSRPTFASTLGPYGGPVPIVTHVHGALGVGDESDGYAEAWFLPAANNIPSGYAIQGTWYDFFANKASAKFGVTWGPGFAVFQYPNEQRASTIWYHDHTLGMTRLNVYAGPAGFFLVRGGPGDGNVKGFRAPRLGDPSGILYTEIPIAIQDRSFNSDGSLFYPDNRAFFDGYTGPYIPAPPGVPPIWNPEFFGNTIVVNGRTWPFLNVAPRRYRLRLLNGCDSRFLILKLSNGLQFGVIGNEGGLLPTPVLVNQLLMGPAERYDVIVDFTGLAPGTTFELLNVGPDEPFGGGDFTPSDPATTGRVMQFRVNLTDTDASTPVDKLNLPPIQNLSGGITRRLALLEEAEDDVVVAALLGVIEGDTAAGSGIAHKKMWDQPITENPAFGATEVWEIYNFTADAHPIHIHEVQFQLLNRQPINFIENPGQDPMVTNIQITGTLSAPEPIERGYKDTFIAYPSQVTRIRLKFATAGNFVWHCHIVEHEDNEMMRPYRIGPIQPGSPENA